MGRDLEKRWYFINDVRARQCVRTGLNINDEDGPAVARALCIFDIVAWWDGGLLQLVDDPGLLIRID